MKIEYDEHTAEKIVEWIKETCTESDKDPSSMSGRYVDDKVVVFIATSAWARYGYQGHEGTEYVVRLLINGRGDEDNYEAEEVFRRWVPTERELLYNKESKPEQTVFKSGKWIWYLQVLPEKIRKEAVEREARIKREEEARQRANFEPIDDAKLFLE